MLDRADKVWPKQSVRFESGKLGSEAGGFGPNVTAITRRFTLGPAALDRQIWTIVRRQGTSLLSRLSSARAPPGRPRRTVPWCPSRPKIGRASCRERVCQYV